MALTNMSEASYGRSRAGFRSATTKINNYLTEVLNAIAHTNDNYKRFKDTVRANWSGDDAEAFLTEVEKARNEAWHSINNNVRPKFNEETGILRNDLEEFVREQSAINVSKY